MRIVRSDGAVVAVTEPRPLVHVSEASGRAEGMSENRSREFINRFLPPARRKVKARQCDVTLDGRPWMTLGIEGAPKGARGTEHERAALWRMIRGEAQDRPTTAGGSTGKGVSDDMRSEDDQSARDPEGWGRSPDQLPHPCRS
jgi:hypothetical protein